MRTANERHAYWDGHLKACSESGLTKVAYCQHQDLKVKSFYYWQRRLRSSTDNPVTLMPVSVQAPPSPEPSGEMILRHASGWALHLPAGLSPAWLASLLREVA